MPMPGLVPKVTIGSSAAASMREFVRVGRAFVGGQLLPARDRRVPILALGRKLAAVRCIDKWCRRARPGRRARRLRSTCCRRSCALPSRARGWSSRCIRRRSRCRRRCRSCAITARMMSFAATPGLQRAVHADRVGFRRLSAAGTAWPARAPPGWCRCRTPARRTLRAWRCGCRRRRWSCRAA